MSAAPTLAEVVAAMKDLYPPALAESWDAVGLVCGDPDAPVSRVLFAVDPVAATVDEAISIGADLLITHHPLFLRPVNSVAADTHKGRLVHSLISNECALLTAHTNADRGRHGVNDALAAAAGLQNTTPLVAASGMSLDKVVTFIPAEQADSLIDALSAAGAGAVGDYSRSAFTSTGIGTFRPEVGATPAIGTVGSIEQVPETRVEMVLPRVRRSAVIQALRAAHPYEEPAFDLLELVDLPSDQGLGRVGSLAKPQTLREFATALARGLPRTPVGLKVAGDPDRMISRVAVLGGAGDSNLSDAARAGVDAMVTGDLRHHPALDHAEAEGPALLDPGHWASEWPWLPVAARQLTEALQGRLTCRVSSICTDPWSFQIIR